MYDMESEGLVGFYKKSVGKNEAGFSEADFYNEENRIRYCNITFRSLALWNISKVTSNLLHWKIRS